MKKIKKTWNKFRKKSNSSDLKLTISDSSPFRDEINNFINIKYESIINEYSVLDFLLNDENIKINSAYINFCKIKHCYESIEFIQECNKFNILINENEIRNKCRKIYNTFIIQNSQKQINLYYKITTDIHKNILNLNNMNIEEIKNIYNHAIEEIKIILTYNTVKQFINDNKLEMLSKFIIETNESRRTNSNSSSSLKTRMISITSSNDSYDNNISSNSNNNISSDSINNISSNSNNNISSDSINNISSDSINNISSDSINNISSDSINNISSDSNDI
jgi:hypothetical protein